MARTVRRVVPLAIVMVLFVHSDAFATVKNVVITEYAFTPEAVKLKIGDSVLWGNNGHLTHTTTSNAPLSLWDSGGLGRNETFSWLFNAAGFFPYHCTLHTGMTANIRVKGQAMPASGAAGTLFTIRVATIDAEPLFDYDIQWKVPGATYWQAWMMNVLTKSVTFDSTGQPIGKYQFRSRLSKRDGTGDSSYSPGWAITVT